MKKLALLSLALVSAQASLAQTDTGGARIGIRGGATYATIGGKDIKQVGGVDVGGDVNYKLSFNAGIALQLPISSDGFWSFAPEILVNRKGFERKFVITDANALATNPQVTANDPRADDSGYTVEKYKYERRRVLTYIDLPLPVRINTAPGGSGLYFELGPQIGYMARSSQDFKQTYKYAGQDNEVVNKASGDQKEDLASFDIGGIAGLGYQSANGLSLGIRYNQGFKSLLDTKDVSARNEPKAFNRAFMLQIGYLLPLGN
ncbi:MULTISPECIES: porin family protein [Hymenobacter]|nr:MULTISPECIES: porin family protein [Hymenobacter]MBC6992298.1 PorT family protein [Hymenobacter sp. BT491]